MASPISITPTLKGNASVEFNRKLEAQKADKVPPAEKDRIFSLVDRILKKSKKKTS